MIFSITSICGLWQGSLPVRRSSHFAGTVRGAVIAVATLLDAIALGGLGCFKP